MADDVKKYKQDIKIGSTFSLTELGFDENDIKNYSFSSSENEHASVNVQGIITAKGCGQATISVYPKDKAKTAANRIATIKVTVTENKKQDTINKPSSDSESIMTTKTTDERILAAKEIINKFNKDDGQKIDEGIKYLENIKPALPLPRTISGHVKIVDNTNTQNNSTTSNSGLLVSISGISNPAEDKEENEEDYSCYTDTNGKFTIAMPDKYNMQETITISVSKKNDMTYAIAGQSASHKVEFVKLASEVLRNEYLLTNEGKKKNAADILCTINEISEKSAQAKEIEKTLNKIAYCEYAKIDFEQQKEKLEEAINAYKEIISEEVKYHIEDFDKDLEKAVEKAIKEKDKELSKIVSVIKDVEDVENLDIDNSYKQYNLSIIRMFYSGMAVASLEGLDKDKEQRKKTVIDQLLTLIPFYEKYCGDYKIGAQNKPQKTQVVQNNIVKATVAFISNLIELQKRGEITEGKALDILKIFYSKAKRFSINLFGTPRDLRTKIESANVNNYDIIKYYEEECLPEFFSLQQAFYTSIKELCDTNNEFHNEFQIALDQLTAKIFSEEQEEFIARSMEELGCDLSAYNDIKQLYKKANTLKETWEAATKKSENFEDLESEHIYRKNYTDPYEDVINMLPADCILLKEKVEDYKKAKDALKKINDSLDYIEELKIEYEKSNISNSYYTRYIDKITNTNAIKNKSQSIDQYAKKQYENLTALITECQEKFNELPRFSNWEEIEKDNSIADSSNSETLKNSTDIQRYLLNFLSTPMDSEFEDAFVINQSDFEDSSLHPRALPSVKLMGDGKNEVYLPTDTAPSRMFNYTIVHRLVEPQLRANNENSTRYKLNKALDVHSFKEDLYNNQQNLALASTLGIGYALNMHQAWVPDGFALGNLLYSLVLAPGEEQRLIVREHKEAYTVSDDANATDRIHDSYSNSQVDNETAAFNNAVNRLSTAHSDYGYSSKATSLGQTRIGIFNGGINATSFATAINSGSGASNSSQRDSYDEASRAAQSFQTSIKTESERIASANRTSIRVASSEESEAVSSRIIANHNHSHVMTVQYWEVARRYRLETCIDGIELLLFVPLELVRFMPDKDYKNASQKPFSEYTLQIAPNSDDGNIANYNKENFEYRYKNILKYYDTIEPHVPVKYRSGLNLIKKFAALPYWDVQKISSTTQKYYITIKGGFCEFDNLSTTIYFSNGSRPVQGILTQFSPSSLKTNENKNPHTRKEVEQAIINARNKNSGTAVFTFTLPYGCEAEDISQIKICNSINSWKYTLSQSTSDMEPWESEAVKNYEDKLEDLYQDDKSSGKDIAKIQHYAPGLPECYYNPVVSFSYWELHSLGDLEIKIIAANNKDIGSGTLGYNALNISVDNSFPRLRLTDIQKIEETFHHIVSDTMYYSQVVWSSLSDDERIILLEPYTIEIDNFNRIASAQSNVNNIYDKTRSISLLNCVNAKKIVGFYGNCMMLPFTFPKELAELIGKTAGDIQDELYRYHSCNFRVPSTVISIPTDGMVGEAVLGATNVSEKIDITRFWNWKDSDIDHIDLDQSSLNGRSLLENASTRDIEAPTVGVTPTEHINGNNLAAALIARQQPTFADVYQNTDMRDLLKNADNNASAGREQIIKTNAELTKAALDAAVKAGEAALTGGASGALGGAGGALSGSSLTGLVESLGKLGLSDSDILKSITKGGGSAEGIIKAAAGLSKESSDTPEGTSPDLTSALKSFGGEKLKQFLSNFASTATNGESLEESFKKSLSSVTGTNKNITLNDILDMSNKFCSENNIDLNSFTSELGKALGLF